MTIENQNVVRRRRFFTCFLVLCVAFGLGIVMLTLACFIVGQREQARRERCENNLKIIQQAFTEYADANITYPPAFTVNADGEKLHSWRVLILPFLGENDLYTQIRLDEPWNSEWNRQFWTKTPNVYRCASTPTSENEDEEAKAKKCAYSCVLGVNTPMPLDGSAIKPDAVVDGGSNTILLVERKTPTNWMDPNSELTVEQVLEENTKPVQERRDFGSWHGAGECAIFCDGSKRFISEKIDNSVLTLLLGFNDAKDLPENQDELSGLVEQLSSDKSDADEEVKETKETGSTEE